MTILRAKSGKLLVSTLKYTVFITHIYIVYYTFFFTIEYLHIYCMGRNNFLVSSGITKGPYHESYNNMVSRKLLKRARRITVYALYFLCATITHNRSMVNERK